MLTKYNLYPQILSKLDLAVQRNFGKKVMVRFKKTLPHTILNLKMLLSWKRRKILTSSQLRRSHFYGVLLLLSHCFKHFFSFLAEELSGYCDLLE